MQNINFSFSLLSDIIVLLLLAGFAFFGKRRGFIKMISGVLVLVLSLTAAVMLTRWTTPYVADTFVEPYVTGLLLPEVQTQDASDTARVTQEDTDALSALLLKLGLSTDAVGDAIEDFKADAASSVEGAITTLSSSVSLKLSYAICFIAFFLISLLVFTLLARLLNLAAKLPVVRFFNRTGGFILGAVWGYIIIFIAASLLMKFNILITSELAANTVVLNFILTKNPLALLPIWS